MRPSEVLQSKRDVVHAIVARHRAANVRVFGSVLRGKDHEGSDLDLLVDAPRLTHPCSIWSKPSARSNRRWASRSSCSLPQDLPESFRHQVLGQAKPL